MKHEHLKAAVVGAWVLAWIVVASMVDVSSPTGWFVLVGSGVVPPLMLLRLWRPATPTMSEAIRDITGSPRR